MPTYEYACKSCGEHTEAVQSFTDDPLTECPHCGGPLRKVFGNIGIAFKGSGFYKNDSRTSSPSGSSRSGGAETSSGDTKGGDTKGDGAKAEPAKGDAAKASGSKGDGAKGDGKGAKSGGGSPSAPVSSGTTSSS